MLRALRHEARARRGGARRGGGQVADRPDQPHALPRLAARLPGALPPAPTFAAALDYYASGRGGTWLGYLGDQTLYSLMAYTHWALFHNLGCEWNRQLSLHFGLKAQRRHSCPAGCGLLHANQADLKCIGTAMQVANGSCAEWRRLQRRPTCVYDSRVAGMFRTAAAKYFAGCCV